MIEIKENIFNKISRENFEEPEIDENHLKAEMIVDDLYFNIFEPRELLIKSNRYPDVVITPMGRKIFEKKSETTGVPVEEIIDCSIKKFGKDYFHKLKIEI